MKTEKKILIAFILNSAFSLLEFWGGLLTGSIAIISDSVHDMGDALSIGVSYFLEKKSNKAPDEYYTFGYSRFSVLGGLFTISILIFGSIIVLYNSIMRIIHPETLNYKGMIIFSLLGICINLTAAFFTHGKESLNQKSVNLHMIEDVLGWIVVFIGSLAMYFTDISIIDPLMSIGVAIFILINAVKHSIEIFAVFLEKVPSDIEIRNIKNQLLCIEGVTDVYHIHIWTINGKSNYATMHVVVSGDVAKIKNSLREKLQKLGICHTTIETTSYREYDSHILCPLEQTSKNGDSHKFHSHHH